MAWSRREGMSRDSRRKTPVPPYMPETRAATRALAWPKTTARAAISGATPFAPGTRSPSGFRRARARYRRVAPLRLGDALALGLQAGADGERRGHEDHGDQGENDGGGQRDAGQGPDRI